MAEFKKFSFLDDFEIPEITHDSIKKQLVKLGKNHFVNRKKSLDVMPLSERLKYITNEVNKTLGRYKNFVHVIRDDESLIAYTNKAIELGVLSFDTETNNSLDPLTCKLMGLCLYMPNTKPVYVPINHTYPNSERLLENQVSPETVMKCFKKLKENNTKMIYHNGKFDIRVCFNTMGVYLPIWWDTMIAAQLMNENEMARLKYQYKVKVDPTIGTYNIEKLFTGLPYAWVDPDVFALYAAIDAYDTYMLQQEQDRILSQPDMLRLRNLFLTIEVPIVLVTSKMEDDGICLDVNFTNKLNNKYLEGKNKTEKKLNDIISPYKSEIKYYQDLGKFDNPFNFDSSTQLSVLMYDVMKLPVPKSGRTTDKDTLKNMKNDFSEALLEYRHYSKLISAFTGALPQMLSKRDNKIHASFNQLGREESNVRTGRFSSTDPNLQQIPSKEKTIRLMFKASTEFDREEIKDSKISLKGYQDVEGKDRWIVVRDLKIGDIIKTDEGLKEVLKISSSDDIFEITI